jgi:hypothetical protein
MPRPRAAHVQAMPGTNIRKPQNAVMANALGSRIVNPARLTPYLADNICMACHQTEDVRVLKPGKTYQDIRPGYPLDDTLSILMIPRTRGIPLRGPR